MTSHCFLITRFNLPLFSRDKENTPVLTEQWLHDRFCLFETYCLPSVCRQTYKEFQWIVLMADDTPAMYKERMEQLRHRCRQLLPLYIKSSDIATFDEITKRKIRELKDETTMLVTLRIDNDDAIRFDYIERAMQLAQQQTEARCGYSFVYGIQYHALANLAMRVPYPNNHFIFMVNKQYDADNFDYIQEYNHGYIEQIPFTFRFIREKEIMWAEVIHQRNVDNDVKGTWRQKPIIGKRYLLRDYFGWTTRLHTANTLWKLPTYLLPAALHHAANRLRERMRERRKG